MGCNRKRPVAASAAIALCLVLLAACQTPAGPIEVTRFHRLADANIAEGAKMHLSARPEGVRTNEQRIFDSAVTMELQQLGFSVSGPSDKADSALYRVAVDVQRDQPSASAKQSPVSVGVGGSVGRYGSGMGIGIAINPSAPRGVETIELSVRISRVGVNGSDGESVWEGRAVHHARAGSPGAEPGLIAPRMVQALFKGFPGVSGATILVP